MDTIQIDDDEVDVEADWTFDVEDYNPGEVENILKAFRYIDEDALEKLERVNWNLCISATVIKTDDGRFLLYCEERHPEMCPLDEFDKTRKWSKKKQAEWIELNERMPSSCHYCWLTRSEAFHILMAFQLPSEFLPDMQAEA